MTRNGGCLCGAVRYSVAGPMRPVIACHCEQCRRSSGNYVTATSCDRRALTFTGQVTWYRSSDTARRGFCGVCGANLFWDGPGSNISIMAGTLDGQTGLSLAGHIFCADKGDYYEIGDVALPRADANDPALTAMVPE